MCPQTVSIITLTYNHCDYIARLYRDLQSTTPGLDWEWLVGASGDDGTVSFLNKQNDERIRVFRTRNQGFAEGHNRLARYARGSNLLFLNNDVSLCPDWWKGLLECVSNDTSGIVGNLILNEDGTIQTFGMGLDLQREEFTYNFIGDDYSTFPSGTDGVYLVPAVTGACMMVRRRIFEVLGGFDECFEGGYYEDTDLCLRAQAMGYRVAVTGHSRITHKGKGSIDVSRDYWRCIPNNRRLFAARWSTVVMRLTGKGPFPIKPVLPDLKAACVDRWLTTMGGGEYELIRAALVFARHCRDVVVHFEGSQSQAAVRQELETRFGVSLPNNVCLQDNMDIARNTDIIWDENYYDLTTDYQPQCALHLKRVMFGPTSAAPAKKPYFLFNSNYTRECLQQVNNGSVVYPPVQPIVEPWEISSVIATKEPIILSVGRFAEYETFLNWKNQLALIDFFHNLPHKTVDGLRLVLIGGIDDPAFFDLCIRRASSGPAGDSISLIGDLDRTTLSSWYKRSMFYVTFCGYDGKSLANNEHFGIALVEAMSAGCISMAYDAGGHREIVDHGQDGFLWNTTSDLARLLRILTIGDPSQRKFSIANRAYFKSLQFSAPFFEMELEYLLFEHHLTKLAKRSYL